MINVSSSFQAAAVSTSRTISARLIIGDQVFNTNNIIDISFSRSSADGGISIGGTNSARLSATVRGSISKSSTYKLILYVGFPSLAKLGTFYITDLITDNGTTTIEAYDRFYFLDKPCNFNGSKDGKVKALTFPATQQEVLNYIGNINGFSVPANIQPFSIATKPVYNPDASNSANKYYTYREIISFIAASNASNAQVSPDDNIIFTRPNSIKDTIDELKCESLTLTPDDGYTVNGVRFTLGTDVAFYIDADGNEYDDSSPGVLEAVNPLATVEIMEYVWNQLGGFHYYAADISRRGRGWLMPDDLISVTTGDKTYNALVTTISYSLSKDGGFEERITSEAESTEQSANRYSPAADHTTNVGAGKYNSTTIVNDPVIIAKNTAEYLQYEYSIVGYNASDDLITYAQDGRSGIIVQGYSAYPYISNDDLGAEHGNLYFVNGIYGSTKNYATAFDSLKFSVIFSKVTTSQLYSLYMLTEYTKDGETTKKYENTSAYVSLYGDFSVAIKWTDIYSPTTNFPNGRARLFLGMNYTSRNSMSGVEERIFVVGNTIDVAFSSIDEYNSAVKLTRAPIEKKDVTQTISKIVEAGGTSDFPELGEIDVLYIDSSDNSAYKWSSKINAYYCVGRDYYAVRKIQSSADPETSQSDTMEAQIMQDMRYAADWTLSSSYVPPKGYFCITDFGDGNCPGIKIGNGNSPWSDLIYCNIYSIPVATDTEIGGVKIGDNISVDDDGTISVDLSSYLKSDEISDWAKSAVKPEYTASEVGAAAESHSHTVSDITDMPDWAKSDSKPEYTAAEVGAATSDDITAAVDGIQIGGRNISTGTADMTIGTGGYPKGRWRRTGTGSVTSESITDPPESGISRCARVEITNETAQVGIVQDSVPLVVGCDYLLSFWARCSAEDCICRVQMYNGTLGSDTAIDSIVGTTWKRIVFKIRKPVTASGNYTAPVIVLRPASVGTYMDVCGIKLETGNKATGWVPASEDCITRITSLEERVAALEAAILSGGE